MPFIGRDEEDTEAHTTEEILYNSARNSMRSGNYNAAVESSSCWRRAFLLAATRNRPSSS